MKLLLCNVSYVLYNNMNIFHVLVSFHWYTMYFHVYSENFEIPFRPSLICVWSPVISGNLTLSSYIIPFLYPRRHKDYKIKSLTLTHMSIIMINTCNKTYILFLLSLKILYLIVVRPTMYTILSFPQITTESKKNNKNTQTSKSKKGGPEEVCDTTNPKECCTTSQGSRW